MRTHQVFATESGSSPAEAGPFCLSLLLPRPPLAHGQVCRVPPRLLCLGSLHRLQAPAVGLLRSFSWTLCSMPRAAASHGHGPQRQVSPGFLNPFLNPHRSAIAPSLPLFTASFCPPHSTETVVQSQQGPVLNPKGRIQFPFI